MPTEKKNLTGQKFGRWTVIEEVEPYISPKGKPERQWACVCECGNTKILKQKNLTSGGSRSCGCYYKEKVVNRPHKDYTDQILGGWHVMYEVEPIKKSDGGIERVWHCKCTCKFGTEKDLPVRYFSNGKTSCAKCAHRKPNLKARKVNTYDLSGEYGIGYDSNGNEFWFDLEDYEKIKDYCWIKSTGGYFIATLRDGSRSTVPIHRVILDLLDEDSYRVVPDHIGGKESRFDNRKSNIRIATGSQNKFNIPPRINSKSGITGVCFDNTKQMWRAYININGSRFELGYYADMDEAIQIRKEAEEKLFKEFSYDNSQKIFLTVNKKEI